MRYLAPGKLLLTGEYAVLEGAPGLAMAVNRHARVTLDRSRTGLCTIHSVQLERTSASLSFDQDGEPCWANPQSRQSFALVDALIRQRGHLGLASIPVFDAQLDSRAFFSRQNGAGKLGLGSSAALSVALALALRDWAGAAPLPEAELLMGLVQAHGHFQDGRGSGIDLAASLLGGVVEYRRKPGGAPQCRLRQLPARLLMRAVWTGRSASTANFLGTLHGAIQAHPVRWKAVRQRLVDGAETACLALGAVEDFLRAVAAYGEDLRALGEFSGLDIYSAEHERLAKLADLSGVTYKPSGAGGGDLGLAMGDDPERLEHFCSAAQHTGFQCPELRLETRGAHMESPD